MISIVVCSYNYTEYLGECIDSLLDQTFEHPYEIIIVDDGSTDDSRKVIESYESEKIRAFFQENAGQFSAFSKGVKESLYDIICFCDCDDTFVPEKLETIYRYFQKYPDVGMVLHKGLVFGVKELEGQVHPVNKRIETAKVYPKMKSVEDYGVPVTISSGLCFRKKVIECVAGFESIFWLHKHYGDILYRAVGVIVSDSLFIPEVLCNYRIHDKSHHLTNFNAKTREDPVLHRLAKEHIYVYVNEYLASRGLEQLSLLDNASWRKLAMKGGGLKSTELPSIELYDELILTRGELSSLYNELLEVRDSWSWKITAPLRWICKTMSRPAKDKD